MSRTVRATRSSSRLAATPGPSKKSGPSVVPVEATTVSGARTVATRRSRRPLARSARKKRAQPDESEIELDLLQCTLAEIKLEGAQWLWGVQLRSGFGGGAGLLLTIPCWYAHAHNS